MGEMRSSVSPARVFARPTADQVWLGAPQRGALSQLSRAASIRVIAGPASSGKTTLLQYVAAQLYPNAVVLQCRGPKDEAAAVLGSLLLSADLAPWDLSEVEQRNLLTVFVQQRRSQKRRVLLLIDDAHTFRGTALDEIERLAVFKIDKKPALELLLAGPTSIARHWQHAAERLEIDPVVTHVLAPVSQEDLVEYLEWRLARFDMQPLMAPDATQMIARVSGGRYAAADIISQISLLLLRQSRQERVDPGLVQQAVSRLVDRHATKLEGDRQQDREVRPDALPQGYLIVSRGGRVMDRIALAQRTLIGRSEDNDVCLASPYLGRHHAVIVGTPEGYYLIDLNSVNGVLLNGRRIERTVLCDEDVLSLGPFRLEVQVPEWLPTGRLAPNAETLADTALMPQPLAVESSAIRRVR